MSEDIIKENNDGKTTEAAVSSTEAALSEIKLHSAPKMRNSEKDMSALKAANDKKFAALKAKMAENMRVAEENGEQRIEELRAERARAMISRCPDIKSSRKMLSVCRMILPSASCKARTPSR